MLKITREMNLSETVFVLNPIKSDFKARYFTPSGEIPLAGHPTIALIFALAELGEIDNSEKNQSISLEIAAGIIRVDLAFEKGRVQEVTMFQLKPKFMNTYKAKEITPLFGLSENDLLEGLCIQTVSTGTPKLMIPLKGLKELKKVELQLSDYVKFRKEKDFSSPHFFCLESVTPKGDTFARHLGVSVREDPFTGSATGNMGCFLWKYGLIGKPIFYAEQGHWLGRPGIAKVEVVGPRNNIETVKVSGTAIRVFEGELLLRD